jgi:hypothetical protein
LDIYFGAELDEKKKDGVMSEKVHSFCDQHSEDRMARSALG